MIPQSHTQLLPTHRFPGRVLFEGGGERDERHHRLALPLLGVLSRVDSRRCEVREVISDAFALPIFLQMRSLCVAGSSHVLCFKKCFLFALESSSLYVDS